MHSIVDFSPVIHDPSVSGTIYPSNVEGWVDDDGFGNVLQAYPMPGATTYATALSTPSFFDIVLAFAGGSDLDSMAFEVGKGGNSDPRGYMIRSSVDGFTTDLRAEVLPSGPQQAPSLRTIDLSDAVFQGQSTLTFRFYVYTPNPPGYYSVDWQNFSFSNDTPAAVPEPGSWSLLGSSIAALALLKRRYRRSKPLVGAGCESTLDCQVFRRGPRQREVAARARRRRRLTPDVYEDDQRGYRGQCPAARTVETAPAAWLRRRGLPMSRIGCAASPRHSAGGALHAARGTFTAGCQV